MTKNYLATINNVGNLAENLRAARAEVGSGAGTGDTYLKIDDRTGDLTYGQEDAPLPSNHRFAVGLHEICHGYVVSTPPPSKVVERHLVPMAEQSVRPIPPDGVYGTYETGGARSVVELGLSSIEEPGFKLTFTAWGVSSANRVGNLLEQAIAHLGTADGQEGFIHPVVIVRSGSYRSSKWDRTIHHVDFEVVDWLHKDGRTLLSQRGNAAIESSWDDEDDMTAAERELLEA